MTRLVLIFDDQAAPQWREGAPPRTSLSHDQNLFQLGHEALRLGLEVHFATIGVYLHGGPARAVAALYPDLRFAGREVQLGTLDPDMAACVHPQVFAAGRLPRARKIGLHPALYSIEMPHTYDDAQTLALLQAVRFHVDHVVVQNERMRELACGMYEWLCRWDEPERVHVAPLGIVPEARPVETDRAAARAALGLAADDVAIVNGGGVWRWTAFNDFLRGYCAAMRDGARRVHLFLAGFKQPDNADHAAYVEETRTILRENADLIDGEAARGFVGAAASAPGGRRRRGTIHFDPDWSRAGAALPIQLAAADFGLNVNADTLENWQSHRVRCVDYVRHGLPMLSTGGDLFSERIAPEATHVVGGWAPEDFAVAVRGIASGEIAAASLRAGIEAARDRLDSRNSFGRLLLLLQSMPPRNGPKSSSSVLEYAWQRRRSARMEEILANLMRTALPDEKPRLDHGGAGE